MICTLAPPHPTHPGCSCAAPPELRQLLGPLSVGPGPRTRLSAPVRPARAHADLLVVGRVVTMDPSQPTAGALAVQDGRILAIGDLSALEGLRGPATEVLPLGDGVAFPGFVEPHMHLWVSALLEGWVDCSPLVEPSFDGVIARLQAAGPNRGPWTVGSGFDPSRLPGEPTLTRDLLDAAVPDRPVFVFNASLHYAYVNSAALAAAGIEEDHPDPPGGGTFGRSDGRLNGILGELPAITRVMAALPRAAQDQLVEGIVAITRRCAARGVTKVHDALTGALLGIGEVDLLHSIADRLATRASYAISDASYEAMLSNGLQPGAGDDHVRAVSWKLISDGSNQGRSGFQREPYLDRTSVGAPNHPTEHLAQQIELADRLGWQLMVHANGDAAIGQVLDAYEAALGGRPATGSRHRIEHCSVPTDDDLARMARLGVSPSFLMNHVYYWGRAFADHVFGPEKAGRLDPMASALRHGLRPSLHSDYTVSPIDPLRSVQTAVTRAVRDGGAVLNPAERVDVEAALRAVTIDAAWQIHADDQIGSLAVGKLADLVVLEADPRSVDHDGIADIGIARTMKGGETTFEGAGA